MKTRRVHVAGITCRADGSSWMARVARNLTDAAVGPLFVDEVKCDRGRLVHDDAVILDHGDLAARVRFCGPGSPLPSPRRMLTRLTV